MVTQPSRRAFLTGRRTPATPWGQFCARLSRVCVGRVRWDQASQVSQAWLEPARAIDVMHAQVLCSELGVQLMLLNAEAFPDPARPILWVNSRADWSHSELEDPGARLWRVDAGVTLGTLHQKRVGIFAEDDSLRGSSLTVAQWFASPFAGNLMQSGIVQAEVLLADGTLELLGPFGAQARTPLRSLSLQKMIPKLFELAQSSEAALCAHCASWPLRYRLDALMPQSGESLNLAWLFQGHGGSLAWLQTIWLQMPDAVSAKSAIADSLLSTQGGVDKLPSADVIQTANMLDQAIKQTLDPAGVFGQVPCAKGLESTSIHLT